MANVSAAATYWNCPNYTGSLYLLGANATPFLNMIGGLQGGNIRTVADWMFPMAQPWALESASQPAITETASLTAPTPVTYVREQDTNTCSIFQYQVSISYAKMSAFGSVKVPEIGTSGYGQEDVTNDQPVKNEKDFQIEANLRQAAIDVEYTFLNGAFQQATGAGVAAKTRGIITAATTNTVNASSATLTRDLLNQLLRTMAANGSVFQNPVIFCNAFQRQKITEIFGYAVAQQGNVGGVSVDMLTTDFAKLAVIWAPQVPAATLLIADLAVCSPVFLPVQGKGVLFYEELSKTGASEKGQIYGQIGLKSGPHPYWWN